MYLCLQRNFCVPASISISSKCRLIDAQNIFMKMERRNLAAAYKFYCGRKMEEDFEAHRADQDTEATYCVLQGELDRYAPGVQEEADRVLNNDMDELAEFSKRNDNVDFAGRIVWQEVKDADGNVILDEKGESSQARGIQLRQIQRMGCGRDPDQGSWLLHLGIGKRFHQQYQAGTYPYPLCASFQAE